MAGSRVFAGVTSNKNPRKKQGHASDLGSATNLVTAGTTSIMRPSLLGDHHAMRELMYKVPPVTGFKKVYYG